MDKKSKILIIKTGYSEVLDKEEDSRRVSLGDVLRITPLLHLYKNEEVTWVTDSYAFPLLEKNPYINRLLHLDWITSEQLKSEEFDVVINLEKVPGICALADKIRARRNRYGFTFNSQRGSAEAYFHATEVLTVSSEQKEKKENKKTTQELLFEMVGAKWNGEGYILGHQPKTLEVYDVALNTQVGVKWPNKAWSTKYWDKLEEELKKEGIKVTRQDKQDTEVLTEIHKYIDWINSSKLVVSNDSLGLHIGIALKKKILGLFGPTPHTEVYFYNRGKAILPNIPLDCLPCFNNKCKLYENSCMDLIPPETVFKEIKALL